MRTKNLVLGAAAATLAVLLPRAARAQYPQPQPQPQPYYPQPQPAQPYPAQPYPAQPYPAQPYPPYPGQPQPYPQPYPYPQPQPQPQPGYYYPQGYGQPAPAPPPQSTTRSPEEMGFLYAATAVYGVGTGVWIDAIGGITDPGLALIAPIALGAAMPVGTYFWDQSDTFHRGTPASIATGIALGGVEGMAISGVQWQATGNGGPGTWGFGTQTTVTFLTATGGGVGGYIFGEALHPDPRSLGFIASGAGWGAIAGTLFGAGVTPRRDDPSRADWKDYASVSGLIGYNAGIAATGVLSTVYTPSWQTQKYMWLGFGAGTAASSLVYVFYLFSSAPPWHGLIANSLGGLAGLGIAAALTATLSDDPSPSGHAAWKPPFDISASRLPEGGAIVHASGTF